MSKKKAFPLVLACLLTLTGCGSVSDTTEVSTPALNRQATQSQAMAHNNVPPAMPDPASVTQAPSKKPDLSIRAVGTHPEGRLVVKPASQASVVPLGAASCYGQETDLNWSGDYEVVWEAKSGGSSSSIFTFSADFEIIQRADSPLDLQKITIGDTDIFVYVPRYTDCHALETYLFGVKDGKAFPVSYEMEAERVWTNVGQLPNRRLRKDGEELIITGGYGAGQDFIDVYHFRYDAQKQSMILHRTDKVKPNEMQFD